MSIADDHDHDQDRANPQTLPNPSAALDVATAIPPGILRSQQAFWRDLPQLLRTKGNHDKWVCYHGDERIGIALSKAILIRDCVRRALQDDSYFITIIRPQELPPWEPEEIEPNHFPWPDESPLQNP